MNEKRDVFFSNNNFELIYELLSNDIAKKFQYNIVEDSQCKNVLFNQMTQCYEKKKNDKLRDINIYTIQTTAPLLYNEIKSKLIEKNQTQPREKIVEPRLNQIEGRDVELPIRDISLNKKLPEYANIRPHFDQRRTDLNNQYEQLSNERTSHLEKKKQIDFSLSQETNGRDPRELFDRLSTDRKKEEEIIHSRKMEIRSKEHNQQTNSMDNFDKLQTQFNSIDEDNKISMNIQSKESYNAFVDDQKNERFNSNKNNHELSDQWEDSTSISEIQKRINLDSHIRQKVEDIDPSIVYRHENLKGQNIKDESLVEETNDQNKIIKIETNPDTREEKHFIEIDSGGRIYDNDYSNRYIFRVLFSPAINQFKRVPMFKNNPTVLATEEQSRRGQRGNPNTQGWFDKEGNSYQIYDNSNPYGEIVGYEDILFSGTNNLYIENIFKNIVEIKLSRILIPFEYFIQPGSDHSPEKSILNVPALSENYLLLDIKEINNIYSSTSDIIRTSFAKLTRYYDVSGAISYPTETGDSSINYYKGCITFHIANDNISKTYYPTPLASLNSMTIRILKPNGEPLSLQKDHVSIRCIKYQSPPGISDLPENRQLLVVLNEYVSKLIFTIYSSVLFRDYMLPININENNSKNNFEAYINSVKGHTIVHTAADDPEAEKFGYINKIYIESQGSFNTREGLYKVYDFGSADVFENLRNNLSSVYDQYNNNFIEDNQSPFGTIINTSFQSTLSFQITTKEGDFKELNPRII